MTYKVEYISTFYTDVLRITDHLSQYPQKAKHLFAQVDKALLDVAQMPRMYPIYEDYPLFRRIVVSDYLVFYKIDESHHLVEVHRLIYGKMELKNQLEETCPL